MKKIILIPVLMLLFALAVNAQKISIEKGKWSDLIGQTSFKLEYNYDNLAVGKFANEQAYIDEKKADYTKKDPAKAEEWYNGWKAAREKYYHPKFEELINKTSKASVSPANKDAKYTLIVKVTFIEPGYNVGVAKKPAYTNFEYIFVETANPSNIILKLVQKKVPGSQVGGYDFDASTRIAESFAKGGKMLGGLMAKSLKAK